METKSNKFKQVPAGTTPLDFEKVEPSLSIGDMLDLTQEQAPFIDAGIIEHLIETDGKGFAIQHDNTNYKTFYIVISRSDSAAKFALFSSNDLTGEVFGYERT